MKKGICLFCCLLLLCVLAGCGNNNSGASTRTGRQSAGVKEVLEAEIEKDTAAEEPAGQKQAEGISAEQGGESAASGPSAEPQESEKEEIAEAEKETAGKPDAAGTEYEIIDVDLTAISGTLVYAEVSNMMMSPDQYIGKTVKMGGPCAIYTDESTKKSYYACIISDATACCAQGIEFVLTDDYKLPDDYPQLGDDVCVIGIFDTYEEGGYTYCTLRNAKLL